MARVEAFPLEENGFGFIQPEDYPSFGIDPSDIPPGTFPARKHPSKLMGRFGGNAYGFGFFEIFDRLSPGDIKLLQSITPENPEQAGKYYREINRIYKNIGILIRYSRSGALYYLIPFSLGIASLSSIKNKADEIGKVVRFHSKKYLQERHRIGLVTQAEDLLVNELSLRFKEHEVVLLDSFEKLSEARAPLDLLILPRDVYEVVFMEGFGARAGRVGSRKDLEKYAHYIIKKASDLLKPEGEIFVIAHRFTPKTDREVTVSFQTEEEAKNFFLFTHVFKTEKRYQASGASALVSVIDFHRYLNPPYVEKEVLERLLGNKPLESVSLEEIDDLEFLGFPFRETLNHEQVKTWPSLLSVYFNEIFLKPLVPDSVKESWQKRFTAHGYTPDYLLVYLGQKKSPRTTCETLQEEVAASRLAGCPLPLVADYRNSFEYVAATLKVVKEIKGAAHEGLPELFMERLREPFENKRRRFSGLNDVLKVVKKIRRLERIEQYLNPDRIEGTRTPMLNNLASLSLFGFSPGELKEIYLIVVGHTPMARILAGKMNEKALKPLSDLVRTFEPEEGLNLLRYARLMSIAEAVASKGSRLKQEEVSELFNLYESMVKVVIHRDMDWDRLIDEKISGMGGVRHMMVHKILKMMNQFQFLSTWEELKNKGRMEKEVLADYDQEKLRKLERVIALVQVIDRQEAMFFKDDALKASAFYRKLLNTEFHGTGRIFERLDSELVFFLLWITVHVLRGEVLNFNPILSGVARAEISAHIEALNEETTAINPNSQSLAALSRFSKQLYEDEASFIVGTGFQLKVNLETQAIDVTHIDMDANIEALEALGRQITGKKLAETSPQELNQLDRFFGNVEGFYQSHLKLMAHEDLDLQLPDRERAWFRKAESLRSSLRSYFLETVFEPEDIYLNLDSLLRHAPSVLEFVLPEFVELQTLTPPETTHVKSSLMDHVLASARKLQALLRKDRDDFQDAALLHKMAQREFGPMTAGIVGLNETQVESLETLAAALRKRPGLMDALVKSFVLRDIGLLPSLTARYGKEIHPADHAEGSAWILQHTEIGTTYAKDPENLCFLAALVRRHNLLHHLIRGEFSFYAVEDVTAGGDKDLFDAIFLSSFIMFYALGENALVEDLAERLFKFRTLCHRICSGEIRPEAYMREVYLKKGRVAGAMEAFQRDGLPEGESLSAYLESFPADETQMERYVSAGQDIYALERVFRLRGIRHAEFRELAKMIVKVPLSYIYRKKGLVGVGYATFEKELFEALRIYKGVRLLPEEVKQFLFNQLVTDDNRIFGFEIVSAYLTYENMIKLLLLALIAARRFPENGKPVSICFFSLAEKIEKRYEAVNEALSRLSLERIWKDQRRLDDSYAFKSGILLIRQETHRVLSVDFKDRIDMTQKIIHMEAITDLEQLKNYFHYSLRSLRRTPYYTEDYEQELEKSFERRMREITELMVNEARIQMSIRKGFQDIRSLYQDLMERALEIGFDEDQKHRLNDLYEMRKDQLRREKLEETIKVLVGIQDSQELADYWDSVKEFLMNNRPFPGIEFENLIARKFDEVAANLEKAELRRLEVEETEEPWGKPVISEQ
jgi:hypothetical protein